MSEHCSVQELDLRYVHLGEETHQLVPRAHISACLSTPVDGYFDGIKWWWTMVFSQKVWLIKQFLRWSARGWYVVGFFPHVFFCFFPWFSGKKPWERPCSQGAHDASPAFPACPGERRSQGSTMAMAHVEMANNGWFTMIYLSITMESNIATA